MGCIQGGKHQTLKDSSAAEEHNSKEELTTAEVAPRSASTYQPSPQIPETSHSTEVTAAAKTTMVKVYIVYYSMYGHIAQLAEKVKEGAESVEGVEASLFQVPEILSEDILGKMHAPPKADVPVLSNPKMLAEADCIIFGFPTRFGVMAAQMKAFMDATGSLWQTQALAGKPAGIFVSTGTQGGGQETTALTFITQLAHHGMIFVPPGYTFGGGMFNTEEVKGGSPYGAGTFAGDGTRQPSKLELDYAEYQGKYTAKIAKKIASAV